MAMTSLNIDYDQTKTVGNAIKDKAEEFKILLKKIESLNKQLQSNWTGDDAESYTAKITEQADVMNKLQATISDIGTHLVSVAKAYQQTMQENKIK